MIGQPKYKRNDVVRFDFIDSDDKKHTVQGNIWVVDAYGTFEQEEEPSYDIMVDDFDGERMLFKHVRESLVSEV